MKKPFVFLILGVLLPGLFLGWLALRDAALQEIVLERRTAELCQKETEGVAASARILVGEQRRAFVETVHRLVAGGDAEQVAGNFTSVLSQTWAGPAVGFALNGNGRLLCPTARDASTRSECQKFLWDNGAFIGNKTLATVYPVPAGDLNRAELGIRSKQVMQAQQISGSARLTLSQVPVMQKTAPQSPVMSKETPEPSKELTGQSQTRSGTANSQEGGLLVMKDAPVANETTEAGSLAVANARNVMPQQSVSAAATSDPPLSQLTPATADFRELTARGEEGVINRFVQDRLNMIFWVRPPEARQLIFGCLIQAADLRDTWSSALSPAAPRVIGGDQLSFVIALLDDKAHAVATQPPEAQISDWKHPFVASEIGEELPHWEAALYLTHPEQLAESARKIRRSLVLLIAAALAAIACGGGLVFADTRRQLLVAKKKTDFVSNVSHELKTPLTSIRMFAELMHDGRAEPERMSQYLRIIMVEAERLTRLINDVLDFACLERRRRRLEKQPLDLHAVVARVWEGYEAHLRDNGFATHWDSASLPSPVLGDADRLAQVLVNLLSNAEKYSGEQKEVTLKTWFQNDHACISVLDRGPGIPVGEETKIFEPFHRTDDSLASGIQGAGLGLTLAQRLIYEHGGTITCESRPGGGSSFTIRLPLRTGS